VKVNEELNRLEHTGVIEKVPPAEWAAHIVPVNIVLVVVILVVFALAELGVVSV